MKILYLPCHSVLEYDQYKLWTEMGHEVFSLGSYINPATPHDKKRPGIPEGKYNEYLMGLAETTTKDNLHPELVAWADVVIVDHVERYIITNWDKLKEKRVIWRTIGQSIKNNEIALAPYRTKGLMVVRYSPFEGNIPGFIGGDTVIRFYKDPEEFKGWRGTNEEVITFAQNMIGRGEHCRFQAFDAATFNLKRKVYGPSNEQAGPLNGGSLSYEKMKEKLRESRAYFYTGTQPASYTLNFIEAWMTGIPIIAIGPQMGNSVYGQHTYEVPTLIQNGVNGYWFDDMKELKFYATEMVKNAALAARIGLEGRRKAIEVFGKEKVKKDWLDFFNSL